MQHFPKETAVLALVVSSLILLAFALLMPTNTITNVSAVYQNGVGVYWDSNCAKTVDYIDWENLTPGSSKSKIVYIRNEIEEPIYLTLRTRNWNPPETSQYLNLGWEYSGQRMNPSETLQIKLTLSISRSIEGISSFSFDIIITGCDSLLGDVNGDGRVDVMDVILVCSNLGLPPHLVGCDMNCDGKVDVLDIIFVCIRMG